jgi:hypothetical protein
VQAVGVDEPERAVGGRVQAGDFGDERAERRGQEQAVDERKEAGVGRDEQLAVDERRRAQGAGFEFERGAGGEVEREGGVVADQREAVGGLGDDAAVGERGGGGDGAEREGFGFDEARGVDRGGFGFGFGLGLGGGCLGLRGLGGGRLGLGLGVDRGVGGDGVDLRCGFVSVTAGEQGDREQREHRDEAVHLLAEHRFFPLDLQAPRKFNGSAMMKGRHFATTRDDGGESVSVSRGNRAGA